ncbi:MAG: hypothetical protein E7E76_07625 [Enterococcus faecalis]|nr:hypothetical protein [Enterococcus faecalis]MDU2090767.1 hypothetical protein [Enterococcus faecalis]
MESRLYQWIAVVVMVRSCLIADTRDKQLAFGLVQIPVMIYTFQIW